MKLTFCTALLTAAALIAPLSVAAENAQNPAGAQPSAVERYGRLPLSFEPTENSARFLARSGSYAVSIGARQSWVAVTDAKSGKRQALGFAFDNANPVAGLQPLDAQPGVTNYYLGADAAKWRLGVKSYAKLRTQGLYPGVDVVYYGDHRQLEFDFVVAPKADPRAIALSFSSMDKIYKDSNGDVVAELNGQPVRFAKPYAYQRVAGVLHTVEVEYELAAAGSVHLRVGDYDPSLELTIDPAVTYATFLGGSQGDVGNGVAVDSAGDAFVTGQTCSSDFPDTPNTSGYVYSANCDAYVTKYSVDTTTQTITYSYTTILGGSTPANATATGNAIALDSLKQAYITGWTNFEDLPGNVNQYRSTYQGGDSDAFVIILTPTGTLLRTTYLGGSKADIGYAIAVDSAKSVIVAGQTNSDDFPAYNGFETKVEEWVAFITKLDNGLHIAPPIGAGVSAISPPPTPPSGDTYYFSEFFGGQPVPPAPTDVWAPNTHVYPGTIVQDDTSPIPNIEVTFGGGITGGAVPAWTPTALAHTYDGTVDWVNIGPGQLFPTYASEAYGVALDPIGDVFVAGGTNTPNIASTVWPFLGIKLQGTGAWVFKASGVNGSFIYGTALENTVTDLTSTIDTARAIAVDSAGSAYVAGTASGTVYTTANGFQPTINGSQNAFLVKVNNPGSAFEYATYLGGTGLDQGLGVAVDASFSPYLTGATKSTDFPIINPITNPNSNLPLNALAGPQDAFMTRFTSDGSALILSAYLGGSDIDQGNAITVNSLGDIFVAGTTNSTDFEQVLDLQPTVAVPTPPYAPPQAAYGGGSSDAFLAMLSGSSLPTVTVTPGSLSFPDQDLHTPSAAQAIRYTNTSTTSTVNISNILFTGSSDFTQAIEGGTPGDCLSGPVAPSTACNIWVVFTPSQTGQALGNLSITDNASTTSHSIALSGVGAVPLDVLTPSSLTFADQAINTPAATAQTVTVKNEATLATLNIIDIATTGDFSWSPPAVNPCVVGTQVAPGGSCTISVGFTPTAAGTRPGTLTITDNSARGSNSVILTGTGVLVVSTVTPNSLTFAQQAINVPSVAQNVTVKNTDKTQTLLVNTPVITGDYQVSNNGCTAPLLPSASCIIQVAFDPTVSGVRPGTLTVSGNGSSMPATVTLTGTAGATSTLAPATLTFAATNPGQNISLPVTLSNQSNFAFNVIGVAISGAAAGDFSQTNNCGTSLLAAPAFCTITVTFAPTAAGNRNSILTVTTDAAASPQTVTLLGTGTGSAVTLAPATSYTFPNQPLNTASSASSGQIKLTSSGTAPLTIPAGGITITGTNAGDFSQTNTCGSQVAAGASCIISVVFTPSALHSRSATLNIADNAVPSPQTISLLGTGIQVESPAITPVNQTLTFANQPVSQASAVQTVTVTNTDPGYPLTLSAPVITGTFQVVAVSSGNNCATTVAVGASCVFGVTFTPLAPGVFSGTLTIASNSASSPVTVQLNGTGGAVASVSPTSLNLGSIDVNTSSTAMSVTLTNSSNFAVNITSVTTSGPSASQFLANNLCGTTVPALSNCAISVTFNPTATGIQTATLNIVSDAATPFAPVALSGNGIAPAVTLVPATSYTFPNQPLNTPSSASSGQIKLTNSGTGPLNIPAGGITITGTNFGDFSQTNTCGSQVAAGANCTISVVFTPSGLNSRSATLTIADNAVPATQTIALLGMGVQVKAPTITPSNQSLTFTNQPLNQASAAQTVTVTNTDPGYPLTLSAPVITGNFQVVTVAGGNNCATTLAEGASCVFGVTFTPLSSGVLSGTLTIASNSVSSPVTVQLSGTGGAVASVSPLSLNLGSANLTESTAAKSVKLTNSSNFAVNITSVTTSGPSASQFSVSNLCGTIVLASGNCIISVTFNPTATGIQTADLNIASDAATPFAAVALSGTGTIPVVTLSPTSVSFPSPGQPLNVPSSPIDVTVKNTGTGPLNFAVQGITITGTNATDFSILTNTCGSQLVVGASCVIGVVFTPTALNSRVADLVLTDDASPNTQTVPLVGNGIAGSGVIELSPSPVNFPDTLKGAKSSPQTVTLTNASSTSVLAISSMLVSGANAADFASNSSTNCPTSLAAGSSCQINLVFAPSIVGAETATLTVSGSASNSPQAVILNGTGTSSSNTAPFTVTPATSGVSVSEGNTAAYTLTLTPLNGFSGTINFTTSGLPNGSSWSISPNPLTMDGTTVKTATLSVTTRGGNGGAASSTPPRLLPRSIFLALLPFSVMGILLINKRRNVWIVVGLVALCLILGMAGCGSSGSSNSTNGDLAPGTYMFKVTATSSANAAQTQTLNLTLVVTQQ